MLGLSISIFSQSDDLLKRKDYISPEILKANGHTFASNRENDSILLLTERIIYANPLNRKSVIGECKKNKIYKYKGTINIIYKKYKYIIWKNFPCTFCEIIECNGKQGYAGDSNSDYYKDSVYGSKKILEANLEKIILKINILKNLEGNYSATVEEIDLNRGSGLNLNEGDDLDLNIYLIPQSHEFDPIAAFDSYAKVGNGLYRLKNEKSSLLIKKRRKKIYIKVEKDLTRKLLYLNRKSFVGE